MFIVKIIGRALGLIGVLLWDLLFGRTPVGQKVYASSSKSEPEPKSESQKAGHEVSEPTPKAILIFVGCFLGTIFATMAALGFFYIRMYHHRAATPVPRAETSFKYAPRAETSIARDWDAINEQTSRHLATYGWIDQKNGITRIPIERAMELTAHEGLPARARKAPNFPPPDQESRPVMETEKSRDVSKSL